MELLIIDHRPYYKDSKIWPGSNEWVNDINQTWLKYLHIFYKGKKISLPEWDVIGNEYLKLISKMICGETLLVTTSTQIG